MLGVGSSVTFRWRDYVSVEVNNSCDRSLGRRFGRQKTNPFEMEQSGADLPVAQIAVFPKFLLAVNQLTCFPSPLDERLDLVVALTPFQNPGILHRPHRMEDATMRTKTIHLTLAALLGFSGALPAAATEYQASDYLPLAVGNSWTYDHVFRDNKGPDGERRFGDKSQWSAYYAQAPNRPQFTIEVLRTEELDGQTYYVISEMPSNWPPAPPHFIAGKTLRWSGTHLMEHRGSGEQALYRFDGADETGYTISTDEGDNRVTVKVYAEPVPRYSFSFHADAYGDATQGSGFRAGYGYEKGAQLITRDVHLLFDNRLKSIRAVLGGTAVEYEDALIPTSTSSSSWGAVKRSLLAHRTGEGRVR